MKRKRPAGSVTVTADVPVELWLRWRKYCHLKGLTSTAGLIEVLQQVVDSVDWEQAPNREVNKDGSSQG